MDLQKALSDQKWKDHKVGNVYHMINVNGKKDDGWKIAYYRFLGHTGIMSGLISMSRER